MKSISKYQDDNKPETQCFNYIPINKNIATSGQPTPMQFEAIAAAGYTAVINLAMHDSSDALYEEGGIVSEAGMNYFHIPVPFDAPTSKHLRLFLRLMEVLEGEKVWLHCAYNWRASAFISHYQRHVLKQDAGEMLVLAQWTPSDVWQKFLALQSPPHKE